MNNLFFPFRMPLAAGLFNRDVYLEAMKRRMNDDKEASSSVCTIQ